MKEPLHRLLRRQLKRAALDPAAPPAELEELLDSVNSAYYEADNDRLTVERSLELSSQELLSANSKIRSSAEHFRSLVLNSSDMIIVINREGDVTYASPSVTAIMGYAPGDWEGLKVVSLIHPDQLGEAAESLRGVIEEPGVHPPKELMVRHLDGSYRWIEMIAQNLLEDPAIEGVVYNARDVTDKREVEDALRRSEERFRSLVQNASDLIAAVDSESRILYASPSFTRVFDEGTDGGTLLKLLHPEDQAGLQGFLDKALSSRPGKASFEARLRRRDGSWRVFEFVGSDQRLNAAIGGFVLNARDVTERRDLEEQLRHQAFHDPLTGLGNRARFRDRLEHALERAGRQGAMVTLLFMDVDNFKSINDGMGHSIGDAALQHVAQRVTGCLRPGDTTARLGGDEFAILLEDSLPGDGAVLAQRILEALDLPMSHEGDRVIARASIGIAEGAAAETDADALLRSADLAMYAAKDAGKGRYEVYDPAMRSTLLQRLNHLRDMEPGIERGEFVLEYQPLVSLESQDIVGVEALVRWRHPTLGVLQPTEFISVAEESGHILRLGDYVLREACSQAKRWHDAYPRLPARTMNVNVSVKQLKHKDFLPSLLQILSETGFEPNALVLEVTESIMLEDVEASAALLRTIREHGVRIAIDDFGTGYSSLSYLSRFPFDVLKIDKVFIDDTKSTQRQPGLARAIIDLGRTFSVEVVAEGIEHQQSLERLRELHCQVGQGFLFGRPGSADKIDELLRGAERLSKAA